MKFNFNILFLLLFSVTKSWGEIAPPVQLDVHGMTLNINGLRTRFMNVDGSFRGEGEMYVPALERSVQVTFTNLRLNAQNEWAAGTLKAAIPQNLLEASKIGAIDQPRFQDNAAGMKLLLDAAKTKSQELPILLNGLTQFQKADFGNLKVLVTELTFDKTQTTASLMAVERMPEGVYIPFTKSVVPIDPVNALFKESVQLDLMTAASLPDVQLPITFKARIPGDPSDKGTYILLNCNGLDFFNVEAEHIFSNTHIKPLNPSLPNVIGSLAFRTKTLSQFTVKASITPFKIVGADDMSFEISDAWIDYNDKENPVDFPNTYFEGGRGDVTWKGFYLKQVLFSLPSALSMKDASGNPIKLEFNNIIYDRGNGMSGALTFNRLATAQINIEGFSLSLDDINISIKKNSFEKLTFGGSLGIPLLKDDKKQLKYTAALNLSGKSNEPRAQFAVKFPDKMIFEAPFLEAAKCLLHADSQIGIVMPKNGSSQVSATLNGGFSLGFSSTKLALSLPFEGWNIGKGSSAAKATGATGATGETLPMSFDYFDTGEDAEAESVPEPKTKSCSGFPFTVNNIKFKMENNLYKFSLDVILNLAGGKTAIGATGGLDIFAKLDFKKLMTLKPWEGVSFDKVAINKLKLEVIQPKFEFKGALEFKSNDPVYGNGFAAALELKVIPTPKLAFKVSAECLFGTKDNYRYFYVNAEVEFAKGIPMGGLPTSIYGFGGGLFNNMEQITEGGKRKYVPKEGIIGLKAMVSIGMTQREVFLGKGVFTFQLTKDWALQRFTMDLNVYLMNRPGAANESAMVKGFLMMDLDIPNQTLSGNFGFTASVYQVMEGKGNGSFYFNLQDATDFYVKLGTPREPVRFTFVKIMSVNSYFMLGKNLPMPIPLSEINSQFKDDPMTANNRRLPTYSNSSPAFAFGLQWKIPRTGVTVGPLSAWVLAGFGFDARLERLTCDGREIGFNGWYASARAYAYVEASVDLDINVIIYKGRMNIARIALAASLTVQLPNPIVAYGQLRGSYSVLGGLVKGKFDMEFEYKEGNPCKSLRNTSPHPALSVPLIADVMPNDKGTMEVYDDAVLSFNLPVAHFQSFQTNDANDNIVQNFYKCRLTRFELQTAKGVVMPTTLNIASDGMTATISSLLMLPEKTKMKIFATVVAYKTDELGNILSTLGTENKVYESTTGEKPDRIIRQIISYDAPGGDQKYWYKGYARPKVVLKQQGYEYLFAPKIDGVDYEYKWRLYKGEDLLGLYELNEYPSDKVLDTVFSPKICYGYSPWSGYYPYRCGIDTILRKGKTIRFDSFSDMPLAKGGTYRIEIIRQPLSKIAKTVVTTTTGETAATSTGEVISTRKLKANKAREVAATYLLYSNTFSISQFTNLADKLALATQATWKPAGANLYRANASYNNIDYQAGQLGYLEIKGTTEPLDKYDMKRVESNAASWQSEGLGFINNKIRTERNQLDGSGTNYELAMGKVVNRLKYMRTNTYNQDLVNRVLSFEDGDIIRTEFQNDKLQVLYNGQNLQTAQSELMTRLGAALNQKYTISDRLVIEPAICHYISSFPCAGYPSCDWCSSWGVPYPCRCSWNWIYCPIWIPYPCLKMYYVPIWEQNRYPFIDTWHHNYSSNKYKGAQHPVKGGVSYWFPKTTPESMYDNFKDDATRANAKTFNFSFTPPN